MRRIVRWVDVEDDEGGRRAPGANEQLGEIVIENLQPLAEGGVNLLQDWSFLKRQLGLAARESVVKAIERGTTGQRLVVVRRDADEGLEERIVA